jgi:hypothetical protein
VVGHDQHVHRGLGVEVAEGGDELVAVDDVGRDLAADDLHEHGVVGHALALILVLLLFAGITAGVAQSSLVGVPADTLAAAHDHADDHDEAHDHEHDEEHDHEHDEEHDHDEDHDHDEAHDHDHDDDHGHAHGEGVAGTRLLVSEAGGALLVVLDLATGAELARFGTPGPGNVYQLPDPQVAVVVHRADHRVTFVHSGLSEVDHGDHADLVEGNPYVLQTLNVGQQPTHFFARGNDIAIFNDGDGTVVWLDRRLLGVSLDYVAIDGREPDHGAVAVVADHAFVGYLRTGVVDVVDRSGATVATFEGCPGLHGQAPWASGVAFGCSDGVLLVEARSGGTFVAHKLANPARSPEGARVGTVVGDAGAAMLVGNFGQGLVLIDPAARSLTPVELPAAPLVMRFAEAGEMLVVLTADGMLHALDPANGAVLRSVAVVDAFETGATRPTMTVLGEHVYVADPLHSEIVEVHVDEFEVERRLPVPFAPGGVAGLAILGAVLH